MGSNRQLDTAVMVGLLSTRLLLRRTSTLLTLPLVSTVNRTMTLVDYQDEFEFGQKLQPEKSIPTVTEFETIWRSGAAALALLEPGQYAAFIAAGLPMRLVTQDTRRVIIATP